MIFPIRRLNCPIKPCLTVNKVKIDSILKLNYKYQKDIEKQARNKVSIALVACSLVFIAQLVFSFIQIDITEYFPELSNGYLSILMDIVMYVCYIGLPFLLAFYLFKFSKKTENNITVKRSSPKKPFLFIMGSLGCCFIVNLTAQLLFPFLSELGETPTPVAETPLEIFLIFCMYAILPAMLEEWAFRGVLLKNLLPYGKWGAIVISAILFGFGHLHPTSIINAVTFGIFLGICYEYTNSLKLPMLAHFINNTIATIAMLAPEQSLLFYLTGISIYVFIGCAIAAIIYYRKHSINRYKLTLIKPTIQGYKLSCARYLKKLLFNVAIIPYVIIFVFFFYIAFLIEI